MTPFHSLCLLALATTLASADSIQPIPLEKARLLDGPFEEIQELHRSGMVGKLGPDKYPEQAIDWNRDWSTDQGDDYAELNQ